MIDDNAKKLLDATKYFGTILDLVIELIRRFIGSRGNSRTTWALSVLASSWLRLPSCESPRARTQTFDHHYIGPRGRILEGAITCPNSSSSRPSEIILVAVATGIGSAGCKVVVARMK